MSRFTPGPWTFEDKPSSSIAIEAKVNIGLDMSKGVLQPIYQVPVKPFLTVGDDGTVFATLAFDDYRQFPSNDFVKMQLANARLMAASPDLLEACKLALEDSVDAPVYSDGLCFLPSETRKALKAAIAKAEGKL